MQTIAEVPEFSRRAGKRLTDKEWEELTRYLAMCPLAGELIPGTGGVRKLRWRRGNRGQRAGVRVIYYFHSEDMPLYLLTVFGKQEQANLTNGERNDLRKVVDALVDSWIKR